MGFDISYHPISKKEMSEWYFGRLNEVKNENYLAIQELGAKYEIDEFYLNKYIDTMKIAIKTIDSDLFEKTHAYYLAVIQGFFRTYYYARGTAFSFLISENPKMSKYITSWQEIKPSDITCPIVGEIAENYSGGVYLSEENAKNLLDDYTKNNEIKEIIDNFFEQNISVFLKALQYAVEHNLGLLEATEVVEPNPINLSATTSFSNLMNCDRDGAFIYEATALAQIREFAEKEGIDTANVIENATIEKVVLPDEPSKKSFLKRLLGK